MTVVPKYARRPDAFANRLGARGASRSAELLLAILLCGGCQLSILEGLDEGAPPQPDGGNPSPGEDGGTECQGESCELCANERRDPLETAVDCGGDSGCDRCAPGAACKENGDCESGVCRGDECAEASCNDDVANGGESDRDCGGDTECDRCGAEQKCTEGSDCLEGVCSDGTCQRASCDDQVKNGGEPSVDCGGPCAPEALCSAGDTCADGRDCSADLCLELRCREPRGGTAWVIPGVIELENFDEGGAGIGFSDTTRGNDGNSDYRQSDVDLDTLGALGQGVAVTQTSANEWLVFTSDIAEAGDDYNVELHAIATGASGRARVEIDGQSVPLTIPAVATPEALTFIEKNKLELPAGAHLVRLLFESEGVIADQLRFSRGAAPFGGKPHAVPGQIEAEDFNVGGEGVAYHAGISGSPSPQHYRSTDVDIDVCEDATCAAAAGTAFHIVDTKSNDWLEYEVDVRTAGTYVLRLRVASNEGSKRVSVRIDDTDLVTDRVVPDTGGWQKYTTLSYPGLSLPAGRHTIRVTFQDGLVNFDWFSLGT